VPGPLGLDHAAVGEGDGVSRRGGGDTQEQAQGARHGGGQCEIEAVPTTRGAAPFLRKYSGTVRIAAAARDSFSNRPQQSRKHSRPFRSTGRTISSGAFTFSTAFCTVSAEQATSNCTVALPARAPRICERKGRAASGWRPWDSKARASAGAGRADGATEGVAAGRATGVGLATARPGDDVAATLAGGGEAEADTPEAGAEGRAEGEALPTAAAVVADGLGKTATGDGDRLGTVGAAAATCD